MHTEVIRQRKIPDQRDRKHQQIKTKMTTLPRCSPITIKLHLYISYVHLIFNKMIRN